MDPILTMYKMVTLFHQQIFKVYPAMPFKVFPAVPTRLSALPAERAPDHAQAPYKDFKPCKESLMMFEKLMAYKASPAVEKVTEHASVPCKELMECKESLLFLAKAAKDSVFSIQW